MRSHHEQQIIPLSVKDKIACINALRKTSNNLLQEALIKAAAPPALLRFPSPIHKKLKTLQRGYNQNKNNPVVSKIMIGAICSYITTEGLKEFKQLISIKKIDETVWHSAFLIFLMGRLKIEIDTTPVVQSTIQNGKVYWRILKNGDVIYSRHLEIAPDIKFTPDNSWLTTWELFRQFKDSGKRFSPVAITKDRFVLPFLKDAREIAGLVWEELKLLGILNAKNRLSHGWRACSMVTVKLNAIEALDFGKKETTTKEKKVWYADVASTLFELANSQKLSEKINAAPNLSIFRKERTPKKWAGTGLISNTDPEDPAYCTRIWDVAVYAELNKHRSSPIEIEQYGEVLNYDHIPSSSALKNNRSGAKHAYDEEVARLNEEAEALQEQGATSLTLRNTPPEIAALNKQLISLGEQKEIVVRSFAKETEELAYTIAIPKKLHHAGETFMESESAQAQYKGHVFLRDAVCHLNSIAENPTKYSLDYLNDFIKALGALRYMYHEECKPPVPLLGTVHFLGRVSHGLFTEKDKRDIDAKFIESMKSFMNRREG